MIEVFLGFEAVDFAVVEVELTEDFTVEALVKFEGCVVAEVEATVTVVLEGFAVVEFAGCEISVDGLVTAVEGSVVAG